MNTYGFTKKIALVGTGFVGMSFAYAMLCESVCDELVLIDVNKQKAEGEAMDLNHGLSFAKTNMKIYAGSYTDCRDADIVVICAGVGQKPGEDRLSLLQRNTEVFKTIISPIIYSGFNGIFLVATNPVDIMTKITWQLSGFDCKKVIGTGTTLDTARLRFGLSEHFEVAQKNIHAYVFGEHGDTSFVPWSCADVSGASLDDYAEMMRHLGKEPKPLDKAGMEEYVHKSGGIVIAKKGATFYAVSVAVCKLCGMLLSAYDSIATVSSVMHGEYGIEDVAISTLTLVGPNGVQGKVPLKLTDEEVAKLQKSANSLKKVISQIEL